MRASTDGAALCTMSHHWGYGSHDGECPAVQDTCRQVPGSRARDVPAAARRSRCPVAAFSRNLEMHLRPGSLPGAPHAVPEHLLLPCLHSFTSGRERQALLHRTGWPRGLSGTSPTGAEGCRVPRCPGGIPARLCCRYRQSAQVVLS